MDDSDDYFQDSFVLDEDDLALLAAEEEKHAQNVSENTRKAEVPPPPSKRQKTCHRDIEEPEIVLQIDGTYGVTASAPSLAIDSEAVLIGTNKNLLEDNSHLSTQILRGEVLSNNSVSYASKSQHAQAISTQISSLSILRSPLPLKTTGMARLSSQNTQSPGSFPPRIIARNEDVTIACESDVHLQEQIAALKAQLENLDREHNQAKNALKEAEVVRFAKEGESNAQANFVERQAAQQHAEDLTKLRQTKEAAEAEQARIQKDMREQMDRLRTEYVFKQHESESSNGKASWSSRSRRIASGPQQSPISIPIGMRNWASSNAAGPSGGYSVRQTPSRRRQNFEGESPKISAGTHSAVPEPKFPGFENSFLQSSPLRSSPHRSTSNLELRNNRTPQKHSRDKGKDNARERGANGPFSPAKIPPLNLRPSLAVAYNNPPTDDFIQDFDGDVVINDGSPRRPFKAVKEGSSPGLDQGDFSSVIDSELICDPDGDILLEDDSFRGIDWNEELHFMLLSHTCKVSETLTLHFLLSATIPSNQYYQQVCSSVLESLGAKFKYPSPEKLMDKVAEGFITMSVILWESKFIKHLNALFDLLCSTMIYIPAFTSSIFQAAINHEVRPHPFLHVLSNIALKSLKSKDDKDVDDAEFSSLIHSMLTLVGTIAWTVPEHLSSCLASMLQTEGVLMTLLDSKQSNDVISHTIQILVLLATHSTLYRPLSSVPNLHLDGQPIKAVSTDLSRVPLLERLSSFLVDASPLKHDENISSILNFFVLLSMASLDGRLALLNSSALVPSLVFYLSHLTTLIWEDDERIMQSPDAATRTVQNMKQTLHLLHQLVFPSSSLNSTEGQNTVNFDFRQKLYHAPHSQFNGLAHMFIVTVGRLSYADPPEWLATELQAEVEKITEPARDLMDLIIEGPESDSVWAAYQDANHGIVTEDDDEMEAHLFATDEPG
ncbi:hypothetical protein EW145_g4910 [Phellinidium pouzarii]|uniref:Uncharacterized protein n=1 Tax=Phellinidium pouzarii TaxID=167371 RepID=A0A4S4L1T3_9AGAM|nr:hypothetical protein EW145_g4910 [Phellinidium pouzarii]